MAFQELGDYSQAEQFMKQGVSVIEKSAEPDGKDYSFAIGVLGNFYNGINRLPEALLCIEKSVKLREKLYGKNSDEYAEILAALGGTHASAGFYEQATAELREVLAIWQKLHGKNHPRYAEFATSLGSIYTDIDDFIQAEPLFDEALRIRETAFGKDNVYYLYTLNNLASLKSLMGDHKQAIRFSGEVIHRMPEEYRQSVLYISSLTLLAGDLFQTNHYEQADSLCLIALPLIEKKLGKNHHRYSAVIHTQARLKEATNQLDEAKSLYQKAVDITKMSLGTDNAEYLTHAGDLAKILVALKQYTEADSMLSSLIFLSERVLGRSSLRYEYTLNSQLSSYRIQRKVNKATVILEEANQLNETILTQQLPYWTPLQREKYLPKYIPIYYSNLSAATDLRKNSGVPEVLYQQSLFLKNLLLNQQKATFSVISTSNNPTWLNLYQKIQQVSNAIATQYTLPISQRKSLDSLEARAEVLEKDLARQSAPFRQAQRALQVRWQDVRDALKPTEAAVEFVSFPYHNGRQQTDSVRYMALVLRPGDTAPKVVPLLVDEAPLRRLLARRNGAPGAPALYATRGSELDTDQLTKGDSLYQLIWQPIDSLLGGMKTVYLASSGLLHQVSFAALPYHSNPAKKGQQHLADQYQIRQVGSTGQVATATDDDLAYKKMTSAKLYGGIQYDSTGTTRNSWPFLPGTQREVEEIGHFIGPQATVIMGLSATEKDLKAQSGQSPTVLHLATHGFAFPDPTVTVNDSASGGNAFRHIANPLFRTGLLLAGANSVWVGGRPEPGEDDGILTAYEVANLNLSNTKLVVLSACETALGDIRGSEGVFGLQRAFKMAGAGYLLTSLWPVSDQATSDLMTRFYRNWKRYKTIWKAFQQTQQQMRQQYPPSVWASFVLID